MTAAGPREAMRRLGRDPTDLDQVDRGNTPAVKKTERRAAPRSAPPDRTGRVAAAAARLSAAAGRLQAAMDAPDPTALDRVRQGIYAGDWSDVRLKDMREAAFAAASGAGGMDAHCQNFVLKELDHTERSVLLDAAFAGYLAGWRSQADPRQTDVLERLTRRRSSMSPSLQAVLEAFPLFLDPNSGAAGRLGRMLAGTRLLECALIRENPHFDPNRGGFMQICVAECLQRLQQKREGEAGGGAESKADHYKLWLAPDGLPPLEGAIGAAGLRGLAMTLWPTDDAPPRPDVIAWLRAAYGSPNALAQDRHAVWAAMPETLLHRYRRL